MTVRRKVFEEFSFNEKLEGGMFGEDDDFSYQLSRKYAIYYNPYAICYDERDYPDGQQAWKVRCTIINLIQRYRERNPPLLGKIAFWWSMLGFILFKLIEAIVMKDFSIVKGMVAVWTR